MPVPVLAALVLLIREQIRQVLQLLCGADLIRRFLAAIPARKGSRRFRYTGFLTSLCCFSYLPVRMLSASVAGSSAFAINPGIVPIILIPSNTHNNFFFIRSPHRKCLFCFQKFPDQICDTAKKVYTDRRHDHLANNIANSIGV